MKKKKKRYITFYRLGFRGGRLCIIKYGYMCTRSYWSCFSKGLRHIRYRTALFFRIRTIG